jgi:hypothetical protein
VHTQPLGSTEVSKFDGAIVSKQDVAALDVTVRDSTAMQVLQTLQNLSGVQPRQLRPKTHAVTTPKTGTQSRRQGRTDSSSGPNLSTSWRTEPPETYSRNIEKVAGVRSVPKYLRARPKKPHDKSWDP